LHTIKTIYTFADLKNTVMAFTRYKRKEKKNRTVSRLRTQMLKLNNLVVKVVSPNKDRVVVIEE